MFCTITDVQSVIIDIDGFQNNSLVFDTLLDFLQGRNYPIALVTEGGANVLNTRGLPVHSPTSWAEATMFQSVLRRALLDIGAKTRTTVFITADSQHLRNATELLIGTVVFELPGISAAEKISICENLPDFIVTSLAEIERAIDGKQIGYGGEFHAAKQPSVFKSDAVQHVCYPSVPSEEHPDCPIHIGGRYFGGEDPRHNLHPLSVRIVHSKRMPAVQAPFAAHVFGQMIKSVTGGNFDFISSVPPRPGKESRLEHFLNALPNSTPLKELTGLSTKISPGLIKCTRDYPELRRLGRDDRKAALNGVFGASQDLTGKVVVLLDDVRTTGSTMDEAIRALKAAGAAKVIPMVLGYHPFPVNVALIDEDEVHCTKGTCGKALTARCNSKTGEPFYGCSGWTPTDKIGHSDMPLTKAVLQKLENIESRVMQPDPELNVGDIEF